MFESMSLSEIVDSCDNLHDFRSEVLPRLTEFREQWKQKINELISNSGLSKTDFASRCGVSRQAQYKWLNGSLPKSHEDYIRIGFAAGLSIDEMDSFLQTYGGYSGLYSRSLEDSVFLFVLNSKEIPHSFQNCETILKSIREEMLHNKSYSADSTMGTLTLRHSLLGLRNERDLLIFILNHVNSYKKKYFKLYDYIDAFLISNSMDPVYDKPMSLNFLADEQQWPASLRQTVYQIRSHEWFPLRKKLISLGLYLNMNVDQINTMLELAQMEPLSIDNFLECILIYAVNDAELNDLICQDGCTDLLDHVISVLFSLQIDNAEEFFSDYESK